MAALAGLLIGFWLGYRASQPVVETVAEMPREQEAASRARISSAVSSGSVAPATNAAPSVASSQAAPSAELSFDPTTFVQEWRTHIDELIRRATQKDPSALRDLAEEVALCERLNVGAMAAERMKAAEVTRLLRTRWLECRRLLVQDPFLSQWSQLTVANAKRSYEARKNGQALTPAQIGPTSVAEALYDEAATAGDPIARTRHTQPDACKPASTDVPGDYRRVSQCFHDYALERLRLALGRGDPVSVARIGRLNNLAIGPSYLYFPLDSRREVLWTLAACELGLDCGPTGPALRWACANGFCGYRSYHQYAADQVLTPWALRDVYATLPRLIATLRSGDVAALLARESI